jgi:UPF0716 protein FxsA
MLIRLIFLFTLIPLVELFLLIKIGTVIGALATIAIVIATGVLGAVLTRRQGIGIWQSIRMEMERGVIPAEKMMDGLLILIAGFVLITPGIITDLFGFSLLFPITRELYKNWLKKRFTSMMERKNYQFSDMFYGPGMKRVNPESEDDDAESFDEK